MKGVTRYQLELLRLVQSRQSAGEAVDLDQMLETLSWQPSKESLQFSIRALITRKLITKTDLQLRRGRKRVCFHITVEGLQILDPRLAAGAAPAAKVSAPADSLRAAPVELEEVVPGSSEVELFE